MYFNFLVEQQIFFSLNRESLCAQELLDDGLVDQFHKSLVGLNMDSAEELQSYINKLQVAVDQSRQKLLQSDGAEGKTEVSVPGSIIIIIPPWMQGAGRLGGIYYVSLSVTQFETRILKKNRFLFNFLSFLKRMCNIESNHKSPNAILILIFVLVLISKCYLNMDQCCVSILHKNKKSIL